MPRTPTRENSEERPRSLPRQLSSPVPTRNKEPLSKAGSPPPRLRGESRRAGLHLKNFILHPVRRPPNPIQTRHFLLQPQQDLAGVMMNFR